MRRVSKSTLSHRGLALLLISATALQSPLVSVAVPPSSLTQDVEQQVQSALRKIPESRPGTVAGVVVSEANVGDFRVLLVPEVYDLVKRGLLELDAVQQVRFPWRLDPEWEAAAMSGVGVQLDEQGGISGGLPSARGPAFGALALQDDAQRAEKALWNLQSVFWSQRFLQVDFELRTFQRGTLTSVLGGVYERVYPTLINPDDATQQLFRERLTLHSPTPLSGMSWLAFRFLGPEEDAMWLYSVALEKTRELTGANRGDDILRSPVSLEEFFGWSGKNEMVEAQFDREVTALTMVAGLEKAGAAQLSESCTRVSGEDSVFTPGQPLGKWNHEARKFPSTAPWLPVEAVMVPRKLQRIELAPRNPYALYGRQVLYIDAASALPAYKLVYDRSGELWKVVISAFGIAQPRRGADPVAYSPFTLVFDLQREMVGVLDYQRTVRCDTLPEGSSLARFDPRRLAPTADSPAENARAPEQGRSSVSPTPDVSRALESAEL